MNWNRSVTLLLAALFPCSAALFAQGSQTQLPKSPQALLQLATESNGLHGSGEAPWHARISWRIMADKTRVLQHGTYEEWWAGPQKYTIVWSGSGIQDTASGPQPSSAGFRQTRYGTPAGLFFTGSADPPTRILDLVDDAIRLPLPPETGSELSASQIVSNGATLHCVSRAPDLALAPQSGRLASAYEACFEGDPPAVRLEQGIGMEVLLDSPIRFQQRWLARSVRFLQQPGLEIDLTFDQIEPLAHIVEAQFTPPPGATLIPPPVHLAPGVLAAYRIPGGLPPGYPAEARKQRIQGTVMVAVVVRKDGLVASVRAVSGPQELREAAMVAVAEWRFHPWLEHGQPVEAEGEVPVQFTLPLKP